MRLWHEKLLPYLPMWQLLGQHRECCALRGLGWGKKHSVVNYVFEHPMGWLWAYHFKVIMEMIRRGYKPDLNWVSLAYRGKQCSPRKVVLETELKSARRKKENGVIVYPEHDDAYLRECLENLKNKGIDIDIKEVVKGEIQCWR